MYPNTPARTLPPARTHAHAGKYDARNLCEGVWGEWGVVVHGG